MASIGLKLSFECEKRIIKNEGEKNRYYIHNFLLITYHYSLFYDSFSFSIASSHTAIYSMAFWCIPTSGYSVMTFLKRARAAL